MAVISRRIKCPNCGRRVFDANGNCSGDILIKCHKCHKIVKIPIDEKYQRNIMNK